MIQEGFQQATGSDKLAHPPAKPSVSFRPLDSSLSPRNVVFWYQATARAAARASRRYRMGHWAEQLRGLTTVASRTLPREVQTHLECLVVVRPYLDRSSIATLTRLRQRGVYLVADFDDLLFAGDPAGHPRVRSGLQSVNSARAHIEHYASGLKMFSAFTTSTEPLARWLRAMRPDAPVTHIPNGVSPLWVAQGRQLTPAWAPGDPYVIRYFPGSPGHEADLASIAPQLTRFLQQHPEVSLEVLGPVQRSAALPQQRVRWLGPQPYEELPRWIATSWVTLAPLVDCEYNRCKSAIKFLESAAFGAPCIASPIDDIKERFPGGALLARRPDKWLTHLESLLDSDFRMRLAEVGRRQVDTQGSARTGAGHLLECIDQWKAEASSPSR